jgi:hypothetical protein
MRKYTITITMPDGSLGRHIGLFADGFEAILRTLESFPDARRVSAMQMSGDAQ